MDFYTLIQILVSSIAATSAMTLFSYAVSATARELYKEPVLLSYILSHLHLEVLPSVKNILAWILHYIIGLGFIIVYHFLWDYNILELTWPIGILLGAISGIIGIITWYVLFKIVPQKPNIDFKGYYLQLFAAHIIFGFIAFEVYILF
ncbi:hypothetical protein [Flavobacterium chungbukense]|uniref:DUF2938 domain-containing protein n=1 Tax=Flavobacterium chungbukense TaxID=877464 RepID=A0ABP7XLV4_9FLAO|nr:hypothetical protein [Flavobacterium chungbukense]MCC4920665.1 hypothetical protein [Flavobacterium chungbukense]